MSQVQALRGRARVELARSHRRRLVVLLILPLGLIPLNALLSIAANGALMPSALEANTPVVLANQIMLCLGPMIGGLAVDRVGMRRTVGVTAISWCAIAALSALLLTPKAFLILSSLTLRLLPGTLLVAALASVRSAFGSRRRALGAAIVGLAYGAATARPAAVYDGLVSPWIRQDDPSSWRAPALILAILGFAMTSAWLFAFRDRDNAAGIDLGPKVATPLGPMVAEISTFAARPIIWGLVFVQVLHGFAERFFGWTHVWTLEMLRQGAVGLEVLVPIVSATGATLLSALWSDWIFRKTRSLAKARLPFIILGFAGLAALPLVMKVSETAQHQDLLPDLLGGTALGALVILNLLAIDLAPKDAAGRFIGLLLAMQLFTTSVVAPILELPLHNLRWDMSLLCCGTLGALLSAVIFRRIRQPEDDQRSAYVRCFT